jgi:hypothetical protein
VGIFRISVKDMSAKENAAAPESLFDMKGHGHMGN